MKIIKPKSIFSLLDGSINFKVDTPSVEIGGLSLLESSILVSLLKMLKAKYVFEFGTYFGSTTKLFSQNTEYNSKIYTIDIDISKQEPIISKIDIDNKEYLRNGKINDQYLIYLLKKKGPYKINNQRNILKKIKLLKLDSNFLDVRKLKLINKFDLIFVDGGHDYETIMSDTKKSLLMRKKDSIIVWHDYKSKIHTDVTKYLNNFNKKKKIFHIKNTMLAFAMYGKYSKIKF
jgi:predicted O-methyltransferase YrrM